MKKLNYSLLIVLLVVCISAVNTLSAPELAKQDSPDMAKAHEDTVPKMRYYRVRCWPGCHVGSDKGMYPEYPLMDDKPIFQTSTINNMRDSHSAQQD